MTSIVRMSLVAVLVLPAFGCGGSTKEETEQSQAATQAAAEAAAGATGSAATPGGADDIAKSIDALARGMSAAAGTGTNAAPVDPVDFRALQSFLPAPSGWERSTPTGERMIKPVSYAKASATFRKGDARIEETITDSGFNQLLIAPFAMLQAMGYAKETDTGFEKTTTLSGFPAYEKWESTGRSGELTVLVGKRFIVELKGRAIADFSALQGFAAQTDLKKLDGLK